MENNNEQPKHINFGNIKEIFDRVISTVQKKLEQESLFSKSDLQIPFRLLFKVAIVNFQGVLYLCDSSEKDKTLLYLNCPSLNRSLFDNLFQTIFLLEDSSRFREQFYKARLREAKEIYQFRRREYGEDIAATNHIAELEKIIDDDWKLTQEQKENHRKLPKHVSTSQIASEFADKKYPSSPLLTYLYELYYWNLSQISHSQPTAFVPFYHHIIQPDAEKMGEFINNERWTAINLFLCLISEIEARFDFGLKEDILALWLHHIVGSPHTEKIYDTRYKELLK